MKHVKISSVEKSELTGMMESVITIECTLCSEAYYSDDYGVDCGSVNMKAKFAEKLIEDGWHSAQYDDTVYICCKKCGANHE